MSFPTGPFLGVDVGGTKSAVGWWDRELVDWTAAPTPTRASPEEIAGFVLDLALERVPAARRPPRRIGVAFPGDLEADTGRVKTAPNVPSFVGASVVGVFGAAARSRWGDLLPVTALNDTCAALLAEQARGAGQGAVRLGYVTVSTGVGGAAATADVVRNLEPGLSLRPDPTRPDAPLEDLAGGAGLARRARAELEAASGEAWSREWAERWISGGDPGKLEAADLAAAARDGEPWAAGLLADSARWVARGIALLREAGHGRDRMVLGGSIALKTAGYVEAVRARLAEEVSLSEPASSGATHGWLVEARLGDERGVLGAILALADPRALS